MSSWTIPIVELGQCCWQPALPRYAGFLGSGHGAGMALLKGLQVAHAWTCLFATEALEFTVAEGTDEPEIGKHPGQLVDGKCPQLLVLVSLVDPVDIGDDKVGAGTMMQEMPSHPIEVHPRRPRNRRLKGAAQLLDDRLAR